MRRPFFFLALLVLWADCAGAQPQLWKHDWPGTDFSRSAIGDWSEIVDGGPPRDGIPALDAPLFVPAASETRIRDSEPVVTLELGSALPRAYPIRYLTWHEIVNDTAGDVPVAVTFCPLCNSAVIFDRRTAHGTLSFGVSGKLRHSDMIMYDRETESWWQQAQGAAIVGELTGTELKALPAWMESWAEFKSRNPRGMVMDEPAVSRPYGHNPYAGYDRMTRPFLYDGEMPPDGIAPLERVVRVGDRAWPLTRIRRLGGVEEADLVISWEAGLASALDTGVIAQGRDVGMVRVRDAKGRDVVHDVMFAFAFHALWPEGEWMTGE